MFSAAAAALAAARGELAAASSDDIRSGAAMDVGSKGRRSKQPLMWKTPTNGDLSCGKQN